MRRPKPHVEENRLAIFRAKRRGVAAELAERPAAGHRGLAAVQQQGRLLQPAVGVGRQAFPGEGARIEGVDGDLEAAARRHDHALFGRSQQERFIAIPAEFGDGAVGADGPLAGRIGEKARQPRRKLAHRSILSARFKGTMTSAPETSPRAASIP